MAGGNFGANQYKKTAVKTASKTEVLLMLYEAAIRNVKKAIECIEKKDIPGKGMAIGRAHDIINELQNSLDFNHGGNIAEDLDRLYTFMTEQLVTANLDGNKELLQSVEKVLTNLLEGWRGAIEKVNKGEAG